MVKYKPNLTLSGNIDYLNDKSNIGRLNHCTLCSEKTPTYILAISPRLTKYSE